MSLRRVVIPGKAATHPLVHQGRASWLPKGFRRLGDCLGFSRQESERRVRMGDFNFIASKENTLCKDFIETVRATSGWKMNRSEPASTSRLAIPPPYPAPEQYRLFN